jgi:hypothetical protein
MPGDESSSGEDTPVIKLTDIELDVIFAAARPLDVDRRDAFLQAVAAELARYHGEIGPGVVYAICREQQRRHFDPLRASAAWGTENRSKLKDAPAIAPGEDDIDKRFTRQRARG